MSLHKNRRHKDDLSNIPLQYSLVDSNSLSRCESFLLSFILLIIIRWIGGGKGRGEGEGRGKGGGGDSKVETNTHTHKTAHAQTSHKRGSVVRHSYIYGRGPHRPTQALHNSFKRLLIRGPNCTPYSRELIMDIFKLVICADWHKKLQIYYSWMSPSCNSVFLVFKFWYCFHWSRQFGANCKASLVKKNYVISFLHGNQFLVLNWLSHCFRFYSE